MPPLSQDLQTGIEVKFDIMSGRCTEKEKRDFHGERSRGDHAQRRPSHGVLSRWSKRMQSGIATQDGVSSRKLNANERTSLIQVLWNAPTRIVEGNAFCEGARKCLIALLLQLCHEVVLLQRGPAAEEFHQRIFQVIARSTVALVLGRKLFHIGQQGARR